MFDTHARDIIDSIADLATMDRTEVRRLLSTAYVEIIRTRGEATAPDGKTGALILADLRRLVSALESVAVFDDLLPDPPDADVTAASAFVAAEALSLAVDLQQSPGGDQTKATAAYDRVEAGLLYLIGGYDINAVAIARAALELAYDDDPLSDLLRAIAQFCCGEVARPYVGPLDDHLADAVASTRQAVVAAAIEALDLFRTWLIGDLDGGENAAFDRLSRLRELIRGSSTNRLVPDLADLYHVVSLLHAALQRIRSRALIARVPAPLSGSPEYLQQFQAYRSRRAAGDVDAGLRSRPFLWPSTLEFVEACLPGPHRDAVVTMPTGSGKSFLAELAIVHALSRGWVLYLTPTNALAHQVRRDLRDALTPFTDVPVAAFVGGSEYSAMVEQPEFSGDDPFVAVMTPEKAALAMRSTPELFARCTLCVFDECHLLNDRSGRGALAELVLAHLFGAAPDARVLFQSAMVANGEELASWIADATGRGNPAPSQIRWRPSRTARGFVIIDGSQYEKAKTDSEEPPPGRAPFRASATLGLVVGLSGPWTLDGPEDYRILSLPLTVALKRSRKRGGGMGEFGVDGSWKNGTGAGLSAWLASSGLPTINFILSSKHHAFSSASLVEEALPGAVTEGSYPEVVEAWLQLAADEFGVSSALGELFRRGIAVHTAALLQVEQAASEYMFARRHAPLMFATGTLAQGLNLPSNAVVVSGSKVGDPRDMDAAAGLVRANELILNGFGRAGRPGFANQSLVVLISDREYWGPLTANLDPRSILNVDEYKLLKEEDASVTVTSSLEPLLDDIVASGPPPDALAESGFAFLGYLSETGGHEVGRILRRTFGGYRKRAEIDQIGLEAVTARAEAVRALFLEQDGVPLWLATAAGVAGVGFHRALRLWQAIIRTPNVLAAGYEERSVLGWLGVLVEVLSVLTPRHAEQYGGDAKRDAIRLALRKLHRSLGDRDDDPAWTPPEEWLRSWKAIEELARAFMSGATYRDFGASYLGIREDEITAERGVSGRLPQLLKVVSEVIEWGLAIDAGCLVALVEAHLRASDPSATVPRALAILPLCLRYGCDTDEVLAWFRYGYRQRMAAHALAVRFPLNVPSDDEALREAVHKKRREWLSDEDEREGDTLRAARVVVRSGAES